MAEHLRFDSPLDLGTLSRITVPLAGAAAAAAAAAAGACEDEDELGGGSCSDPAALLAMAKAMQVAGAINQLQPGAPGSITWPSSGASLLTTCAKVRPAGLSAAASKRLPHQPAPSTRARPLSLPVAS
jgi:hypothetical protein